MASNPLKALIKPRLPAAAIGLSGEGAGVVSLDRRRNLFAVRRAGYVPLPEGLVHPLFDDQNIADAGDLTTTLAELVTSVGLQKRRRWSVALPEAATRTAIVSLESTPGSRSEVEEMLRWKIERNFGAPLEELRVSRRRLEADGQERARYLVTAVRLSVLAEYEEIFAALEWRAGLILPRHMGEAWWLIREGNDERGTADSLLVSGHPEGFTAVLMRGTQTLLVRSIVCEAEDRADELYRFLLFYRDRFAASATEEASAPVGNIERLLVAGSGFDEHEASGLIEETLAARPRLLDAADVRLALPSGDLDFHYLAAPAGLAALAWS